MKVYAEICVIIMVADNASIILISVVDLSRSGDLVSGIEVKPITVIATPNKLSKLESVSLSF